MPDHVHIEIETAIRKVSWASAQVGQKSLQTITIDLKAQKISSEFRTGKTHILGLDLKSARDSFVLVNPRFNESGTAFFSVKGQTASGVRAMPNIDYRFTFEVSATQVKFSGVHDGYPSYNVSISGFSEYDYEQGHLGQLLGDSDVKVGLRTVEIK